MPENISTLWINAPQQKVWDTVTKPALVKQWQYGSDVTTSWEPGSPIKFSTAFGDQIFEQWGTVTAFQPTIFLAYSLFAPAPGREDIPENYFTMRYELSEEEAKTKLVIIQEDNRPNAKQEPPQGEENPALKLLKEIAEAL